MPFIKIYPMQEIEGVSEASFGNGNPARCLAQGRFGAKELYLNIDEISAFEECPLYLISPVETDALVNGIRIRLRGGSMLVVADDPENDKERFLDLLGKATRGEIAEMEYSRYLLELELELERQQRG